MIQFISRKKLDVEKYDACVAKSKQNNLYGLSWFLDSACVRWGVLVLNDYDAVMPIPWRRRYTVKCVYSPFWTLQLGIFSEYEEDENEFLIELFSEFKYVELRTNSYNSFSMFQAYQKQKQVYLLSLNKSYEDIFKSYKKERKRDLQRRVKKYDLIEKWDDNPENLIELYKKNIGRKVKRVKQKDYDNLLEIITSCIDRRVGEVLSIYDKDGHLVASGFFVKDNNSVSLLVSSTDLKKRRNGANTFLIDRALYKYQRHYDVFDFGAEPLKSSAKTFLSFGAEKQYYMVLKYNNLPKHLRLFKR